MNQRVLAAHAPAWDHALIKPAIDTGADMSHSALVSLNSTAATETSARWAHDIRNALAAVGLLSLAESARGTTFVLALARATAKSPAQDGALRSLGQRI